MDEPGATDEPGPPPPFVANANADNRAVARNALAGYGSWGVNLLIGLVITPVIFRGLGVEGFGAWTLAITVASYVGMVELGLGVATVRHIAASLATGDVARTSAVAATARAIYLAMACLGTLLLAGLLMLPGVVVETGSISSDRLRLTIFVLGVGFLLSLAVSVYSTIAIGAGRTDLGVAVGTAVRIGMAVAQVVVVVTTGSLVLLAVVTAAGVVGTSLAIRTVALRRFRDIDVSLSNANRSIARLLLASGWRNYVIAVAAVAAIQSDVLVVGIILGPAAVAAYGIAVRASTMAQELAFRATNVLVPTFAHSTALEDTRRTLNAFRESAFLARALLVPAVIVFVAFGEQLLRLWLGEVPVGANDVLVLLVLGATAAAPGHSAFTLLTGMNRLTYLLVGASIAAVGNLALSVLLTWQIGIIGPALGSLAAYVIWNMLILPRHVGLLLGVSWLRLSAAGLGPLLLPALCGSAVAAVLVELLDWRTPGEGLVGAAITSVTYFGVLSITLGSERRARYLRLLRGITRHKARPT